MEFFSPVFVERSVENVGLIGKSEHVKLFSMFLRMEGERTRKVLRLRKRLLDEQRIERSRWGDQNLFRAITHGEQERTRQKKRFKCLKKFHSKTRIFFGFFLRLRKKFWAFGAGYFGNSYQSWTDVAKQQKYYSNAIIWNDLSNRIN